MSDESAAANVITPFEKRIVELILEGHRRPAIAQKLHVGEESLKIRISRVYGKLGIADDGIHSQSIRLVLLIHERRAEFGIRCKVCDVPCNLGAKCRATFGPCDRGLSCKAFWCDIGP